MGPLVSGLARPGKTTGSVKRERLVHVHVYRMLVLEQWLNPVNRAIGMDRQTNRQTVGQSDRHNQLRKPSTFAQGNKVRGSACNTQANRLTDRTEFPQASLTLVSQANSLGNGSELKVGTNDWLSEIVQEMYTAQLWQPPSSGENGLCCLKLPLTNH